jgi:hypothetical protein
MGQMGACRKMVSSRLRPLRTADNIPVYYISSFPTGNNDFVLGHSGVAVKTYRI